MHGDGNNGYQDFFICELLYVTATCLIKISFCLTLLRISNVKGQVYSVYAVLTIVVVFSLFYFFFILSTCQPVSHFWLQFLGQVGKCRSTKSIVYATYAHGVVMSGADLVLAIIPCFLVWSLQMNRKAKITVASLLAFGSLYVPDLELCEALLISLVIARVLRQLPEYRTYIASKNSTFCGRMLI